MVISILYFFPIVFCFSAAWTYSNQQVFMNRVVPKTDASLYPATDHHFAQWFTQVTPGTFCVLALSLVVLVRIGRMIQNCI